ncbi:EscU/YscU/HrcU family type III secretion system export apparatus switch protein [Desertibacillus haloalkaliphilus]|uniref:EscU/YscU/HrcU family type III secretion system export apparatus switch protein n=1 Tax=Desertibacillus haloalkaliphilus TaxID=1328930 RepID=UPI001C264BB9|nr:EscU/YscU/HrcU family type III secretion system export apparatus switch protein [Desertibacillus haloalkaliphilus]MBU8907029.1 EscU/YscU/HrcU family type III secretion system export apparatus switch protein [Desertibacillus haloalkaliphilus]
MKKDGKKTTAVAIGYDETIQDAPKVIAKGHNEVAKEILRLANEHQIPVQEDPSLVQLLSQLELNQSIPPELYEIVAEVFAFIYRIDRNIESSANDRKR